MKGISAAFGVALLLQGCTYAISSAMVNKTDKAISFERLRADPDLYKGKLVILGGTIAGITSVKRGTLIEVVQKPLDYWGKPKRTEWTGGRFLVLHPRYLNAMTYAPGREITVAAEIKGTRGKELGEAEHNYPVMISKELKLWGRERPTWERPQWVDPLYDPHGSGRRD